jgi:hypothetical protein
MREFLWTEVSQIGVVKIFSFGFMEAYDITIAFIDPLSYIIPSCLGINPSNIPVKNIPTIH